MEPIVIVSVVILACLFDSFPALLDELERHLGGDGAALIVSRFDLNPGAVSLVIDEALRLGISDDASSRTDDAGLAFDHTT